MTAVRRTAPDVPTRVTYAYLVHSLDASPQLGAWGNPQLSGRGRGPRQSGRCRLQ
jgi:hypothetical protein